MRCSAINAFDTSVGCQVHRKDISLKEGNNPTHEVSGFTLGTADALSDGDEVLVTDGDLVGVHGTIVQVLAFGKAEVRFLNFGRDAGTFAIELSYLTRSDSD